MESQAPLVLCRHPTCIPGLPRPLAAWWRLSSQNVPSHLSLVSNKTLSRITNRNVFLFLLLICKRSICSGHISFFFSQQSLSSKTIANLL